MELKYKVVIPFGGYERGQDIPAEEVSKEDLLFNRVVAYHYSAPPPQKIKETPPPSPAAVRKDVQQTTDLGE